MPAWAAIPSRLGDLYRFFISIGYIGEDQICWPPHSSENLDLDGCRAKGYTEAAIFLLQTLPWPRNHFPDFLPELIHKSKAIDYSDEEDVEGGRHPTHPDWDRDEEVMQILPGHMITLSRGEYDEGWSVILDAHKGKIKEWFQDSDALVDEGVDACEYLEGLLQRYKSLEQIPVNQEILSEDDDTCGGTKYKKPRQMLLDYGWPDAFRKDDFNRDINRMQEQWEEEDHHASDRQLHAEIAAMEEEELAMTEAAECAQ